MVGGEGGGGGQMCACVCINVHVCISAHVHVCMCVDCASVLVGIPNYCVICTYVCTYLCISMYMQQDCNLYSVDSLCFTLEWRTLVALPVAPSLLTYTTVLCVYVRTYVCSWQLYMCIETYR